MCSYFRHMAKILFIGLYAGPQILIMKAQLPLPVRVERKKHSCSYIPLQSQICFVSRLRAKIVS